MSEITEEIEITEEMIDEGERAFYESRFEAAADCAILIYEAMVRASPDFHEKSVAAAIRAASRALWESCRS